MFSRSFHDIQSTPNYRMVGTLDDGPHSANTTSILDSTLAEWTSKELQLSQLHEEILLNREALLNCSIAYSQSQESRLHSDISSPQRAYQRNGRLLQDLDDARESLHIAATRPPPVHFRTLLKNYWAMVNKLKPLWEESVSIHSARSANQQNKPGTSKQTKSALKKPGGGRKAHRK